MRIKVHTYPLWRNEESGRYYTAVNGTPVEISRELYYQLMSYENEDRYDDAVIKKRNVNIENAKGGICSQAGNQYIYCDMENQVISKITIEEILKKFEWRDQIIIRYFITKELTSREIEEYYGIPRATVQYRASQLKEKIRKIFKKFGQN